VVVRIRYSHTGVPATLEHREDGGVEARFDEPQIAVTPGQLAGFYQGDRCIGGAEIRASLPSAARARAGRPTAPSEAPAAR